LHMHMRTHKAVFILVIKKVLEIFIMRVLI
jgi:hypothetical protein